MGEQILANQYLEYYSAIKRENRSIHTATCTDLWAVMQSKDSRSQKVMCCLISFIQYSQNDKTKEMESRLVFPGGRGAQVGLI